MFKKIEADKLYGVLHKLVPQACLFTIVEMPKDHNNECSKSTSAYDNLPSTTPLPYIDSSLIDPVGTDLLSSPNPPSTDPPSLTNPQSSTDPPSSSDSLSSTDPQSSSDSQSTDPPLFTDP